MYSEIIIVTPVLESSDSAGLTMLLHIKHAVAKILMMIIKYILEENGHQLCLKYYTCTLTVVIKSLLESRYQKF